MTAAVLGAELRAAFEEWRRLLASQQAACAAGDYTQMLGLTTEADWVVVRIGEMMARLQTHPDGAEAVLDACRFEAVMLRGELAATMAMASDIRDGIVRRIGDLAQERQRALAVGYGRTTVKGLSVLDTTG